jgi:hypothetical protein
MGPGYLKIFNSTQDLSEIHLGQKTREPNHGDTLLMLWAKRLFALQAF